MKNKIIQIISSIMVLIPWTILIFRTQQWALESPTAEIMIITYCILMIGIGIFTLVGYNKFKVQTTLMKICTVINTIYAVAGVFFLALIIIQ